MYKLWILIAMQIFAIFAYYVGSRRFYKYRSGFMKWLAIGIILDIMMAVFSMAIKLPKMSDHCVTCISILFKIHVFTATIGMLGFIIMFFYLACLRIIGKYKYHNFKKLRKFQYWVLLWLWIFGVSIGLLDFLVKIIFGFRLYDLL